MSLLWKIIWTIVLIAIGCVSFYAIIDLGDAIINGFDGNIISYIISVLLAFLSAIPAWFAWKGTKIVPFFPLIARIILIIVGCFIPPLLVVFALIDIWLKE